MGNYPATIPTILRGHSISLTGPLQGPLNVRLASSGGIGMLGETPGVNFNIRPDTGKRGTPARSGPTPGARNLLPPGSSSPSTPPSSPCPWGAHRAADAADRVSLLARDGCGKLSSVRR
jgi:hypothetical protein